jgi:hypothetical protein
MGPKRGRGSSLRGRKVAVKYREQNGQEIAERSEDRQAYAPTVAVLGPEQRDLSHDIRRRHAALVSLGKHLGLFTDNVQIKAVYGISDKPMSAEEWKKQYVKPG